MADPSGLQIAELCDLNPAALEPLLAEETAEWAAELHWDHAPAANLVRGLFAARRLSGIALKDRDEVAGYAYAGLDGNTGLMADVYVRPRWRTGSAETTLLSALFDLLAGSSAVTRIEGQLMLVAGASARDLERERAVTIFERALMEMDSDMVITPATKTRYRIEPWSDDWIPQAGAIMQAAYAGQADCRFHNRYASVSGAERFLQELIQFPGAAFCRPASCLAFDPETGSATGLLISSFVAPAVGHIAELCVSPQARRTGLGRELVSRSTGMLRQAGAQRISLAVTVSNEPAVRLYSRFGFRERRRFHAYLWEKS